MKSLAGDPVLIAADDQFCLGMAGTFLSAFRDEKTSNWKAVVYAPTVGPSRDNQGELIAITSKNCDYNVQPGLVIIDLFKQNERCPVLVVGAVVCLHTRSRPCRTLGTA